MGNKVHPFGFRVGVYEDWKSHWFAKGTYGKELLEDYEIRKYLNDNLYKAEISKIVIDKAGENIRVIIHTAQPGKIIGKKGKTIGDLKSVIGERFKKPIDVSVQEVKEADVEASLIARMIAHQLERRVGYKRLLKKASYEAMKHGALGIKIRVAGRLAGAEIARIESIRLGKVPLHTLRAKIDYASDEAKTTYGIIGVQVWVYKGEY